MAVDRQRGWERNTNMESDLFSAKWETLCQHSLRWVGVVTYPQPKSAPLEGNEDMEESASRVLRSE
jgi:hypothetical protein